MPDTQYLSPEKFEELQTELNERKTKTRKLIAEQLEYAKQLGDLSENFEYHDAKDKQAENEGRIFELENLLKSAVIVEEEPSGGSMIRIGTTFAVERDDKLLTFTIVGSNEANPIEGKISNESPMGKAFIGAKAGDTVGVETPSGAKIEYKVKTIQ